MTFKKKIPDVSKEIYKEDLVAVLQDKYAVLGPLWVTNQLEWLNGVYSSFKNHDNQMNINS